jgi:tripartite-type tricarboxylate transporter receptor subunit TctC
MKLIAFFLLAAAAGTPLAQSYPAKPVRVIVPYPPGGADVAARLILPKMQEELGQPLILENRPGANGVLGTDQVSKHPADGYTLLWNTSNPMIAAPATLKSLPYDAVKDFTHITLVLTATGVLVANPSLPADNLAQLIAYAKKAPGKVTYASTGVGSSQHMDPENLKMLAGIELTHVPYKGFGQSVPDLIAGHVQIAFMAYQAARTQVEAGKLKLIAIAEARRDARFPNVAAVAETVPGFVRVPTWGSSLHGPAGLPRPIVSRIHGALVKAVNTPDVRKKVEDDAQIIVANTPEEFEKIIAQGIVMMKQRVKDLGIPLSD